MDHSSPKEVFATLSGLVDQNMSQRVFTAFATAVNQAVPVVHLLIQSTGGAVGDGIGIYNYLRNLPIKIIAYNGGSVSSAAVLIYLAAKERKASETAAFLIHKSTHMPGMPATSVEFQLHAQGLRLDDERSEAILRANIELPDAKWELHKHGDLYMSAKEAQQYKIVHQLADFSPPPGSQVFNV